MTTDPSAEYDPELDDADDDATGYEQPDDAAELGDWVDPEAKDE